MCLTWVMFVHNAHTCGCHQSPWWLLAKMFYPRCYSQHWQAEPQKNQDKANQKGLWLCSSSYFDPEAKWLTKEHTWFWICLEIPVLSNIWHPFLVFLLYVLLSFTAYDFCKSWKLGKQHGQLSSASQRTKISGLCLFILNFQLFGSNFAEFVVVMV